MNILIIGGSGGIGTALIDLFITSYPEAFIYATYQTTPPSIKNPQVSWFKIDISSEQEIISLANHISNLDILINAAGALHQPNHKPEKSVNAFSPDFFQHNLNTNVFPTIYLAKHFSKHLKSKNNAYFISISARIGSIEDNRIGGWISYRCSKAALNMAIKTVSIEWKYKLPNCCVFAFHPGTTDTNLSKPFQKSIPPQKIFTPHYVASCLLEILNSTTSEDSGKFFSYDGTEIPW